MSTASLYAGRTVDVLAFRGQQATGDQLLAQDVIAGGGQVCTGVTKLAQWFVTELLKVTGTMPFAPLSGTNFYQQLSTGRLRTETDVFTAFGFAVGTITAAAKAIETAATPPDEQFASAVLNSVAISPGYASLSISLASQAGTARQIILPLPTTPN